jgi:hypothetical protein
MIMRSTPEPRSSEFVQAPASPSRATIPQSATHKPRRELITRAPRHILNARAGAGAVEPARNDQELIAAVANHVIAGAE